MAKKKGKKRRGRGEGSVYQRGDGRWVAAASGGVDSEGRRRRTVAYGATKAEALQKLEEARKKAPARRAAGETTVAQAVEGWFAFNSPSLEVTSAAAYRTVLDGQLLPRLGGRLLRQLTRADVAGLYADMLAAGVGSWARVVAARLLRLSLAHAVQNGLAAENVAQGVPVSRPKAPEMVCLTAEQMKHMLSCCRARTLWALTLAAYTGMRRGEVLGLSWADVSADCTSLSVRQTYSVCAGAEPVLKRVKTPSARRTLALPRQATELLLALKSKAGGSPPPSSPVISSKTGGRVDPDTLRNLFGRARRRAAASMPGFPPGFRFHDARHFTASVLLSAGASVKAVAAYLGHANPATTLKTYSHHMPGDGERIAALMEQIMG